MRKRERLKLRQLKWKNNDRFATEKVKDREREREGGKGVDSLFSENPNTQEDIT